MAEPNRFIVIFEQLEAAAAEQTAPIEWVGTTSEIDEIGELAQLSAAMRDPEPPSYTIG